jgi:hypothetical protein
LLISHLHDGLTILQVWTTGIPILPTLIIHRRHPFSVPEFETLQLHAGQDIDSATNARAPPIYASASFVFNDSAVCHGLQRITDHGMIKAISHGVHFSTPQICLAFVRPETFILASGTRQ